MATQLTITIVATIATVLALVAPTQVAAQTGTITKHFCFSSPFLLGGIGRGFTACVDPNATTCVRGFAGSEAWVRDFRSKGEPTFHLFDFEYLSPFPQMHRLNWDANALFYQRYGHKTWVGSPNIIHGAWTDLTLMRNASFPWTITNVRIDPDSQFVNYRRIAHVDEETGIGMILLTDTSSDFTDFDMKRAALRGFEDLKRRNPPPKHVVVFDYYSRVRGNWTSVLSSLQNQALIKIDVYFSMDDAHPEDIPHRIHNGTFVTTFTSDSYSRGGLTGNNLVCMDMLVDLANDRIINASRSDNTINPIPNRLKTNAYFADVNFSQVLANEAVADDPDVGYTTFMPVGLDAPSAPCLGGDCGQGVLLTDSYIHKTNSDIAFQNSGGLRGPGWPAGPVKYSAFYTLQPWPDTMAVANLTGLSVWEIVNHSASYPLVPVFSTTSGRLLQISGLRVRYGHELVSTKVLSIDWKNKATGVYEPLERLKIYKCVTTIFESLFIPDYELRFNQKRYRGETQAIQYTQWLLQNAAAEFLTATTTPATPYNVQANIGTRYVNATTGTYSAASAMNWVQTQGSCGKDNFWDAPAATCMPCPEGQVQPKSGQTSCKEKSNSTVIIAIVVPLAVLLIVLIVLLIVVATSKGADARDVGNAPTSGQITIMFTDIESSTKLWTTVPSSMNHSLEKHHALVRAAIQQHKGYEVKTVGDSFMIACKTEDQAMNIGLQIQRSFQAAQWPPCIAKIYEAGNDDEKLEAIEDDLDAPPLANPGPFNGLRIRIGIQTGTPKAELDEVSKGYDYYGPMVNEAARVEAAGIGGQICCTKAVLDRLTADSKAAMNFDERSLGKWNLKGVAGQLELFEVLPKEMTGQRVYKPKAQDGESKANRADADADADDNKSDVSQHSSSANSSSSSMHAIDAETEQLATFFFQGMLKMLRPSDRKATRAVIMKSWHINDDRADLVGKRDPKTGEEVKDEALSQLCRRAVLATMRDRRKAAQRAAAKNEPADQ